MKALLKITLATALALGTAQSFAQNNDDKGGEAKPTKKHVKVVTIEDGVKTELDTVIVGDDNTFFFRGEPGFGWAGEMPDSAMMSRMHHFWLEGRPDGKGARHEMHVFRGSGGQKDIREFEFAEDDSSRCMMFARKGEGLPGAMFMSGAEAAMPPRAPMMSFGRERMKNSDNLIRLDSPDIISYKKKTMKNGTEKIEIVRKQPKQKEIEIKTEVRMDGENVK
ncbi:MAG: hypothetical protein ACK5JD_10400 [Mangrovibacterium sp.]